MKELGDQEGDADGEEVIHGEEGFDDGPDVGQRLDDRC